MVLVGSPWWWPPPHWVVMEAGSKRPRGPLSNPAVMVSSKEEKRPSSLGVDSHHAWVASWMFFWSLGPLLSDIWLFMGSSGMTKAAATPARTVIVSNFMLVEVPVEYFHSS